MKQYVLNNGIKMPALGFGTWNLNGEICKKSMSQAIKKGYRLIDTAAIYLNESEIGEIIRESGIPRKDFFVTSKVWTSELGYERTIKAFENTLARLGFDYLDLYLIHWPSSNVEENSSSWRAMEDLHEAGKIRSIGVSNFTETHLQALMKNARIMPAVDQIEFHPFYQRKTLHSFLEKNDIRLEAWYPLAGGDEALFSNPALLKIAHAHHKDVAQIVLRWHMQKDVVAIPKSSMPAHKKQFRNLGLRADGAGNEDDSKSG